MAIGPLAAEVFIAFCLASCLLYRYGNWFRHHIIVTLAVLIAWYFSFLIIFVLPLDVSAVSTMQPNLNFLEILFCVFKVFIFIFHLFAFFSLLSRLSTDSVSRKTI